MRNLLKIFKPNSEYSRGSWALILPKNWSLVDEDDEVISFAADGGFGALQLSSYIKDGVVSDDDLLEFSGEMGNQTPSQKSTINGQFTGFLIEATDNVSWMRSWSLRCNSTMIFATYTCAVDDRGSEDRSVDKLLSTLTYKRQ